MNNIIPATHPVTLIDYLARLGLGALLNGYVDRNRVHAVVNVSSLEIAVQRWGYRIDREGGNVYGCLRLVPDAPAAPLRLRIVTRSDHSAVYGTRRRAA